MVLYCSFVALYRMKRLKNIQIIWIIRIIFRYSNIRIMIFKLWILFIIRFGNFLPMNIIRLFNSLQNDYSWQHCSTAACIIIELRGIEESQTCAIFVLSPLCLVQTCQLWKIRIEKWDRRGTKNGRVRYLPDMLLLGRQNTAGARQQESRCRGRRGRGSGPMAALWQYSTRPAICCGQGDTATKMGIMTGTFSPHCARPGSLRFRALDTSYADPGSLGPHQPSLWQWDMDCLLTKSKVLTQNRPS